MKQESQEVVANLYCDFTGEVVGRHFHSLSIGPKSDVLVLSLAAPAPRFGPATNSFVLHLGQNRVELPPTTQFLSSAQPMLGGSFLCVAHRCGVGEKNAHAFSADGSLLDSWHVGDGIEDVQATRDGQLWISYFDEGVYGGTELSHQGLNCFGVCGQRLFGFGDARGTLSPIDDCYALNVANDRDAWLFYYSGFPLVHLRDRKVKAVYEPPEMIGSHAFAVQGLRFLFLGGYTHKKRIFWRDESRKLQVELDLRDGKGEPIGWQRARGRGADLFLLDGPKVWRLSLDEIAF